VVLLQESEFSYHFSARLRPWVHYVPLSYSAADLIDKLEWLRAHDDLAQRIAKNAKAFGDSYLRLEDHLCYAATALSTVGRLLNGSDALDAMDPRPVALPPYYG
jgi:protein glucosyltransferase